MRLDVRGISRLYRPIAELATISSRRERRCHASIIIALLPWLYQTPGAQPIDNDYVRVTRNAAPCGLASPSQCGERVLVALGPIEFQQYFKTRRLERGEIAIFLWHQSYTPPTSGEFLEVSIKHDSPKVPPPAVPVSPDKTTMLFDGETFFVFEERLAPGETSARHSHAPHLVIVLNDARLDQRADGQPEEVLTEVAGDVHFNLSVTHVVTAIGEAPHRNIIIELKP